MTIVYGIACLAFIVVSHFLWIEKTTVLQATEQTNLASEESNAQQETIDELLPLTKNWPATSVEKFKQALEQEKPFKIVIAGSSALGGETGWAQDTKARLIEAYGADYLTVEVREYDMTSEVFIAENKHLELADLKADLILFEPFILKNNGGVEMETTLANLTTTIDAIKQAGPESTVILQPANPIYKAKIYPTQIDQLKNYAVENDLVYLDHWGMWPDPNSVEIKDYLSSDQSLPNEKGNLVWTEFISAYLIGK
jgi:hypothetical protein